MKKLTLNEIQASELLLLIEFKRFCQDKGLSYSLAGGTLLGAIRHRGFIPWDDDIDVCMPRPDYERFVKSFKSDKEHIEILSDSMGTFNSPFAKIIDISTCIESKYSKNSFNSHLWIDIFPIDGLPESTEKTVDIYRWENFYRRMLVLTDAQLGEGKTFIRRYGKYILIPIARMYGAKRCSKKMRDIALTIPYETAEYVGIVTWGLYGVGERMKKKEFLQKVTVTFEGEEFSAFSCWDSYLQGIYGDYMQLPPIEKRKTHDMTVFVKD